MGGLLSETTRFDALNLRLRAPIYHCVLALSLLAGALFPNMFLLLAFSHQVVQENVRVLPNGETVSVDGTHLGHNLPDGKGNRYCINLVCVAGRPTSKSEL